MNLPLAVVQELLAAIIPVYHFLGFSSPYDKEEMVRNMINRYRNDLNFVMVVLFYKRNISEIAALVGPK